MRIDLPKETTMVHCDEMKLGQIYFCEGCGLELKVVNECEEDCGDQAACECGPCEFVCCDAPLKLKEV